MDINDILRHAIAQNASDVHLFVDQPPIFRIDGELFPSKLGSLNEETLRELIFNRLPEKQKATFEGTKDLDFSYSFTQEYDFRFNIHFGMGKIAATIRILPQYIKTREELNLPPVVHDLAKKRQGLIVVSGTAGSGKSTTLTYMINLINSERKCKIITIEDPIEFHHKPKQSFILQREIGVDTLSFATALKYALRQDPDVVVVGEMRDHESIAMALTAVETGHLVLTTVHAPDAIETINRIVDVYPTGHRDQIFTQLSRNLLAIISQVLVPRKNKSGRVLATEMLISTVAIQNLIRRGALVQLRGQMDADQNCGTHSRERLLVEMVYQGMITEQTSREYANYIHTLEHFKKIKESRLHLKTTTKDSKTKRSAEYKSPKIIIIDSNDHTRVSTVLKLTNLGYENVLYAASAAEGLEIVKKENPDIIVVDIVLSDRDSFDLCREIRSLLPPETKIIMVSNFITRRNLQLAQDIGVNHLVTNTFDHKFLLQAIDGGTNEDEK